MDKHSIVEELMKSPHFEETAVMVVSVEEGLLQVTSYFCNLEDTSTFLGGELVGIASHLQESFEGYRGARVTAMGELELLTNKDLH